MLARKQTHARAALPRPPPQAFKLTQRQLVALALGAASHTFLEEEEAEELRERMKAALPRDIRFRLERESAAAASAASTATTASLAEGSAMSEDGVRPVRGQAAGGGGGGGGGGKLPPAWRRMWAQA